jgi:hypothetical protein
MGIIITSGDIFPRPIFGNYSDWSLSDLRVKFSDFMVMLATSTFLIYTSMVSNVAFHLHPDLHFLCYQY